jgi:hypothetical protein
VTNPEQQDCWRENPPPLAPLPPHDSADLATLGRHTELVAELRALTDRHPLREQFWA